jgi:hypothetical protein
MKMIHKLVALFLILFITGQTVKAQGPSPYSQAIGLLTDFIQVASQAQADAQQVDAFATAGNVAQFNNKLADLQRDIAELDGITAALVTARVPDRSFNHSLITLRVDVMATGNVFSRLGSGPWSTGVMTIIGASAVLYKEGMRVHKARAQEIRIGLCCAE